MSIFAEGIGLSYVHGLMVLALVWLLCRCLVALRPGNAGGFVRQAIVLLAMLALFAFLPIPNFTTTWLSSFAKRPASSPEISLDTISSNEETESVGAGFALNWESLQFDVVESTGENGRRTAFGKRQISFWMQVVAGVSLLCLIRQGIGLVSLCSLLRQSLPIRGGRVHDECQRLAGDLGVPMVDVRSTTQLHSAATAGWLRPVILLPEDHQAWTDEEMRAVLAHELGHVRNGDYVWRLLACFYSAIHFCNPLSHWLRNRLILEQEVLADRIASDAMGSRRNYLRVLSALAMRADQLQPQPFYPGLLSVTSTNLLRRIDMLRAKDGSTSRHDRRSWQLAICLMACASVAATGLRVSAERSTSDVHQPSSSAHEPFDPNQLPSSQGAFVLRPARWINQSSKGDAQTMLLLWKETVNQMELPAIDLERIELIAGNIRCEVHHTGKTIEPGDEGDEHRLVIGADGLLVRTRKPMDLVKRVSELFPTARQMDDKPGMFLLEPIPALGPYLIRLRVVDDRNLLLSVSPKGHKWLEQYDANVTSDHSWAQQWRKMDTGEFTMLFHEDAIDWPETRKTWLQEAREAIDATDTMSVSVSAGEQPTLVWEATLEGDGKEARRSADSMLLGIRKYMVKDEGDPLSSWFEIAKVTHSKNSVRVAGQFEFPALPMPPEDAVAVAQPAKQTHGEHVQLHLQLHEVEIDALKQLQKSGSSKNGASHGFTELTDHEIAHAVVVGMNREAKVSIHQLEELRESGKSRVIARPVLATLLERPAGIRVGAESCQIVVNATDNPEFLSLELKLDGTAQWETDVMVRSGESYLLPVPSKSLTDKKQLVCVIRTELISGEEPVTASKASSKVQR